MINKQEEFSRICSAVLLFFVFLVFSALGVWYCLCGVLPVNPDMPDLLLHEERERSTFVLCTLLSPLLAWGAAKLSFCTKFTPLSLPWLTAFFAAAPLFLLYCDREWFDTIFYFAGLPLSVFITAAAFGAVWWCHRYRLRTDLRILSVIFLVFSIVAVFNGKLYPMTRYCMVYTHHSEPLAYAISQAAAGNFEYGQYGGYSMFLAPLFALTGGGMRFFLLVMTILSLFVVWLLVFSLREVRNRWLTVMFFFILSVLVFNVSASQLNYCIDPYFQYFPIRALFPALWLYWLSVPQEGWKVQIFSGSIAALALMWNLDSGIAVAGSAIFLLLLRCISTRDRYSIKLTAVWLAAFAAVSFCGWYMITGFDLSRVFKAPQTFVLQGVNMLPMQRPPAMWMAVLGVYAAMLLAGIRQVCLAPDCWYKKRRTVMFLGGAVLGLGLFCYYQWRSHVSNLAAVSYVAVWGGILFADSAERLIIAGRLPKYVLLCTAGLAVFPLFYLSGTVNDFHRIKTRLPFMFKDLFAEKSGEFYYYADFISKLSGGRPCIIWSEWQGALYLETGLRAAVPGICRVELHDPKEEEKVFNAIKDSKAPIFITRLIVNPKGHLPRYVLENYEPQAASPDRKIWYLEPKSVQK